MFCVNCGAEIKDNYKFCGICGQKVQNDPVQQEVCVFEQPVQQVQPQMDPLPQYPVDPMPQYPVDPMTQYPVEPTAQYPVEPIVQAPTVQPAQNASTYTYSNAARKKVNSREQMETKIKDMWRTVAASPFMLIAAVCSTILIILNLTQIGTLTSYFSVLEVEPLSKIGETIGGITMIMLLPSALIAVGLWLVFIEGNSRSEPRISTSGLTCIRISMIINIVMLVLALCVLLFSSCGAMSQMSEAKSRIDDYYSIYSSESDVLKQSITTAENILLGTIIGSIIAGALSIVYYSILSKAVRNSVDMLDLGCPNSSYLTAIGVIKILALVVSALSMFSTMTSSYGGFSVETLLSVVSQLSLTVLVFSYKNKVEQLENEYFQHK